MRQVDIQFVVAEDNYEKTVIALHGALIEPHNHEYAIVAASTTAWELPAGGTGRFACG